MSKPIHVLQMLEATAGGTRRHLDLLLQGLPQDQFRLSAVVGDRGEDGFADSIESWRGRGVDIHHVSMGREVRPLSDWAAYRSVQTIFNALQPDVVHTHAAKAGFLGRMAARGLRAQGTKVIHTPHVFPFQWARGIAGSIYHRLDCWAARHADVIICLSDAQRQDAVKRPAAQLEQLHVIPNGVDTDYFHPAEDDDTLEQRKAMRLAFKLRDDDIAIGMIGRLAPQKATGMFVRIAAQVADALPNARFFLVGSGPLEETIRDRAKEHGLTDRFHLLGGRNRHLVKRRGLAKVTVHPKGKVEAVLR